tara:strand:- start:640 stop:1605 length:966 start_codon:yes stop_codon:yes gene_type:complete
MNFNPIIIVGGEPQSIFIEILLKAFKKVNNPIILISSKVILKKNIERFNYHLKFNELNEDLSNLKKRKINLIDINYNKFSFSKKKITSESNEFIKVSFNKALEIQKNLKCMGLINGPISKKTFLKGRFNGITEYLAKKTDVKDPVMLIYNEKLSVSPLTTHIPISKVSKKIKKKHIISKIKKIDAFYKKVLRKKPNIAITGLNPHCESFGSDNKEKREIIPAIKHLRKCKIHIKGPYASDTIFLKENSKKFDVIFGMYHDQVLGPMKTLYGFKAINLTIGLPFIRISPDHGPNVQMLGKNKSDPESLVEAIRFFEKYAIHS